MFPYFRYRKQYRIFFICCNTMQESEFKLYKSAHKPNCSKAQFDTMTFLPECGQTVYKFHRNVYYRSRRKY